MLLTAALCVAPLAAGDPIELGARRELLVDRHLIEGMRGAELRLHPPRREDTALVFDRPWEGPFSAYATVLLDGDTYRLYYRGLPAVGGEEVTCVAESRDGVRFTRPSVALFEIGGTRDNNVVLAGRSPLSHNLAPFLDARPGVPAEERYKAIGGNEHSGLHLLGSGDGLSWRPLADGPVFTAGMFDSQNVCFWSEAEERYALYFRVWTGDGYSGLRAIARATSEDLRTFSAPERMTFGAPQTEHFYTNATQPYFRAPHLYVAFPKRFLPGRVALGAEQAAALVDDPAYRRAAADAVLFTSRGGGRYDREFPEAWIRPGPSQRDWISRSNAPACGVVPAADDPRTMYVYRLSHYGQPTAHLTRYSLRTDGFASASAGAAGGELTTRPVTFSGRALELNYATSAAGGVRVELQGEDGAPLEGFALDDCAEMFGDELSRVVRWTGGTDLEALVGETVRLRFALRDADLFAFRFRPQP